jgi:hypothetical protein
MPFIQQRPHHLDRQRGDVVVGDHAAAAGDRHPSDPAVVHVDALDRLPQPQLHARAAQVTGPRRQPGVAGRRVEHAIRSRARACEVEQQLDQDQPARARADLPRPGGDERAREPVGEELLERRRAPVGLDEVPPAAQLPLLGPALVAARQQREQPVDEERDVVDRDAERRRGPQREACERLEV